MNIFHMLIGVVFVLAVAMFGVFSSSTAFAAKKYEADFVANSCVGVQEAKLPGNTRVDCLTGTSAIEYDYQKKWAECIGQALFYGAKTDLIPICRIICTSKKCKMFLDRIGLVVKTYHLPLKVEYLKKGVWYK